MTKSTRATMRNRIVGGVTIVAPSLLLGSSLAFADEGGPAGASGPEAILVPVIIVFALVIVGLALRLGAALPRVGAVLLLIGLAGVVGGAGAGVDGLSAGHAVGTPPPVQAPMPAPQTPSPQPGSLPDLHLLAMLGPGTLFSIAFVAIGVALMLAEPSSRRRGAAIALAGALFPVLRVMDVGEPAILSDIVFVVTLALIGWPVLRRRRPDARRRSGPALT